MHWNGWILAEHLIHLADWRQWGSEVNVSKLDFVVRVRKLLAISLHQSR